MPDKLHRVATRRTFLKQLGAAGAAVGAAGLFGGCGRPPRLPNIVLIFTDDLGYGDIGAYGATGYTTPHLDRLATEGIRFTDFYASQAVCSASRASLLTGCYAQRVSILGALGPQARVGLNPEETEDVAFWIEDINEDFGATVIMVEHDMNLVSTTSDRVMAMANGAVLAIGKPPEIQSHPEVLRAYLGD